MPFDERLAERVRRHLAGQRGVTEKKMFGGIAFLLHGNMCCGVHGDDLIVRLDPTETDRALAQRHVRVFDLTGRPMKGWVLVAAKGLATDAALGRWTGTAVAYAGALPARS